MTFKLILALAVAASLAFGEDYVVVKESSLSSAAEAITVQQPAATAATVRFYSGWIDCSVTCTVTIERNGTAATATALTRTPLNNTGSTSKATAWSGSDVGTGTVIGKFTLWGGGGVPLGLDGVILTGTGTTKNVTVRIASMTGTVHVDIRWSEVLP